MRDVYTIIALILMSCTLISSITTGIYITAEEQVLENVSFDNPSCVQFAYQLLPYEFFGVATYVGALRWIHINKV
jgi:hypothetical protein